MMSQNKKLCSLDRLIVSTLLGLVVMVNIIRFIGLEMSPPGFQIDEAAGAVSIQCLAQEGTDAMGRVRPFFGLWDFGSPKPPTYMYLGLVWSKLFGFSIASFRAISGLMTALTILGLFMFSQLFWGRLCGLMVALAATISPWAFQFSRLALENSHAPCFIIWGSYFFLRSNRYRDLIFSGFLFSMAMYSYPPARVQMPLAFIALLLLKRNWDKVKGKPLLANIITWLLFSLPLIVMTFKGVLIQRFDRISMFNQGYLGSLGKTQVLPDLAMVFIHNFLMHFRPTFLFFSGDHMLLFSSQFVGHLSWLDTFAILIFLFYLIKRIIVIRRNSVIENSFDKLFLLFIMINIAIAIVPSALTMLEQPHASRALGAWPYFSLLTGFVLWKGINESKLILPLALIISVLFSGFYLKHYFTQYPQKAYWQLSAHIKEEALSTQTGEDWRKWIEKYAQTKPHVRYYLMNYHGAETCSSSRVGLEKIR